MEREIIKDLVKWKETKNRKPLIIHGARQVGKTYNPKYAIRIFEKNFGFENNIKFVPLYAVFCI